MLDVTHKNSGQLTGELPRELKGLQSIVSDEGGLINRVIRISNARDGFSVFSSTMGSLEHLHGNITSASGRSSGSELGGAGGGTNQKLARAISIAEATERYSSCVFPADLEWAAYEDIKDEAIDVALLPACSPAELANPKCRVRPLNPKEKIRWVTGWSLTENKPTKVPAVSVWLHIPPLTSSERFTLPISTGCATHTDLRQALANAICELIERDAIALTWLQQMPLPRLTFDRVSPELEAALHTATESGVVVEFFDATSELGIPTFYSVDTDENNSSVRHMVMCATGPDPDKVVIKMLREMASSRIALSTDEEIPDDVEDFHSVFHGARYMGMPNRSEAFRFLLDSTTPARKISDVLAAPADDAGQELTHLLATLTRHGMHAVAVDITTNEARAAGLSVVRVIIPELMPLSFAHTSRYLAHPRLYSGPKAMGFPSHAEPAINANPQPFA